MHNIIFQAVDLFNDNLKFIKISQISNYLVSFTLHLVLKTAFPLYLRPK